MLYTINTNDGTGKPVKNATISFIRSGVVFNKVAFPNNTGTLYFDSVQDADLFSSDVTIRVEAFGYNTAGTTGNGITGDWEFTLRPNGLDKALYVGLGLGGLLLLATTKGGKKKVGGIDVKNDIAPLILPVGIIVGGIMVYNHFFGKSEQDKARDAALQNDIAAGPVATMSDTEIAATANQIKEDLGYSAVSNDTTDAVLQLTKPRNTTDVLKLVKAYGKHIITFFGIPTGTYTLEETVVRQMSDWQVKQVNEYYDAQGINFNF